MRFENLTMVPDDVDAMDISMLTEIDRVRINAYHKEVYEKISPYLEEEEKAWLKEVTKEVQYEHICYKYINIKAIL